MPGPAHELVPVCRVWRPILGESCALVGGRFLGVWAAKGGQRLRPEVR